jgi:hypothetical protein
MANYALSQRSLMGRAEYLTAEVALQPVLNEMEGRMLALQESHKVVCTQPAHSSFVCPTCYAIEYALAIVYGSDSRPLSSSEGEAS